MPELLTFVETNVFTKRLAALGLEGSLRGLQLELLDNPEAGDVEPGTAGLRKIPRRGCIYLMFVYAKNEASTLTADQKRKLRAVVAQIKATDPAKE